LLSVRVLGPLEVSRDGVPVRLGAAKQRALLGLMLIRRGDVDRDVLIDALWGERPPKGAKNTLQVYVSSLRKVLGPGAIETTPAGYRLQLEPGAVDAEQFQELFRDGRDALRTGSAAAALELLSDALVLWRGPAYADLRYEAFAQAEAGRLEEMRFACLEERIEAELQLGRHAGLVGELEALVVEQPLRERVRGQLILALYRSGRQSEALEQYRSARRMLSDELGLDPSPELRELERMILAHDPELAPPQASGPSFTNLPLQPTPFIGRVLELDELVDLIRGGSRRIVTLTGPGGSGKTRMAIEAANRVATHFPEGVWWVPLQSSRDPTLVLPAVGAVLQAPDGDVAAHVGDRRMLLVLDNFEQLLEAGVSVAGLLTRCAHLRLLVTSREPLHVAAEREFRVRPMTEPDAVALFEERAAQEDGSSYAAVADRAVTEICRRLDYLPLAVELAAARTKAFTPQQILARLEERLSLLADGPRDAPARQQTLRATIAWSYELLRADDQRLLRDLSVFVGGCTVEAADAICGATQAALESLLEKSLLQRHQTGIGTRYSMLETIQEFAREATKSDPEYRTLCLRHAEWYRACSEEYAAAVIGEAIPEWSPWTWFGEELPNVRAALEWAFEHADPSLRHRLAASAGWAWVTTASYEEGRSLLTRVLETPPPMPPAERARVLFCLGEMAALQGKFAAADSLKEEALKLFEAVGDTRGVFHARLHLVGRAAARGDIELARARLEQTRVAGTTTLAYDRALTLFSEARLEAAEGNYGRAQSLVDEGLSLLAEHGRPRAWDMGRLVDLAWYAINAGDLNRAKSASHEILEETSVESPARIAHAHGNLALVALYEKDRDAAAAHLRAELEFARAALETPTTAEALVCSAAVASMDGNNEQSVRLWAAADAMRQSIGNPLSLPEQFITEHYLRPARAALSEEERERVWAEGVALTLVDAVADALDLLA
jgi:predicted ATPase/DNA-binding SARP family transcriptional activator